ncbi:MAG: EAL domain-containing protein, partial [Treponema sp.]|nr:EAL domain-containing protein [Treponema sp.]
PVNILKIDKSFIDQIDSSESSKKYIEAIISIGHILNLEVISEGVETDGQLEKLKSIGCDYIQGYIWGKPMPPDDAGKFL